MIVIKAFIIILVRFIEYLMNKRVVIYIVSVILVAIGLSSCCQVCVSKLNKNKDIFDHYVENDTVIFKAGLGHGFVGYHAFDSINHGFIYGFSCFIKDSNYYATGGNPPFTIHNLSFITEAGDTIPYKLFYYYCGVSQDNSVCKIIPTKSHSPIYPLKITRDMVEDGGRWGRSWHDYLIFASCDMSSNELKKIYVNYDVEVYGKHYRIHKSLYQNKIEFDCRPKFW